MIKNVFKMTLVATLVSTMSSYAGVLPSNKISVMGPSCVYAPVKATSTIKMNVNLSSNDMIPAVAPFSPSNPQSFNFPETVTVFDSLGISHVLSTYFVKTAANTWNAYVVVDNVVLNAADPGVLTFSSTGILQLSSLGLHHLEVHFSNGAKSPQFIDLDMTCSTQFGMSDREIEPAWQDGRALGLNFHKTLPDYAPMMSCVTPAIIHPTTQIKLNMNLNASDSVPSAAPVDPAHTETYNYNANIVIYDSLGAPYLLSIYFAKDPSPNYWNVSAYMYGTYVGAGHLEFTSQGILSKTIGLDNLSWKPYTGAQSPQYFSIDMTCSTQYGVTTRSIENPWQDGLGSRYLAKKV